MGSLAEIPQNIITKIILEAIEQLNISSKVQVEQDFVKALGKAANLFIFCITSEANSIAAGKNRRTIYAQDIFNALSTSGLDYFLPTLVDWHSCFVEEKGKSAGEKAAKKKKDKASDPDEPMEGQVDDDTPDD